MDDVGEEFDAPPKKKAMFSDKSSNNDENTQTNKFQDGIVLDIRKRLKEENSLQAVHTLLNTAKNNAEVDIIYNYIKAGGGPLELLKVLQSSDNKKNLSFVCPIFSSVHLVILKISTDFPHLVHSAEEACCYLLHECTPVLHSLLSTKSSMENKKLVLCLLTAVVSLSYRLARDVLSSFSLEYKTVEHLTEQVNPSDGNSVRVRFIHFLIAFMVEGNALLIKQLLQNKGLLRLVLRDMIYDNASIVESFLTLLYEKVVLNNSIPKTTKLHAFNTAVLTHLVDLYSWLGPKSWTPKRKLMENSGENEFKGEDRERENIRFCVHELLTILCTSHKQGIVFQDKLLGTSQCQNTAVRSLFKNIEMAWNDDLIKDLTLKILVANPDLIKSALSSIKTSFKPSSTIAWMSTCTFLKQLIESVQLNTKHLSDMNFQLYIRVFLSHSMPTIVIQHIFNEESLKNPDAAVRFSCISLLETCLQKMQCCLTYFKDDSVHFVSKMVMTYLSNVAPKFESLLNAWIMKTSSEVQDTVLPRPSLNEYLTSVIDSVLLLHSMYPEFLHLENTEDVDINLLSSIEEFDDSNFGTLELKVISVISILKPLDPMNKSFSKALNLHINHLSKPETKYQARKGLEKILLNTGCLDGAENEVEIWLHCLETYGRDGRVETFFLDILRKAIDNIGFYFKCIVDAYDGATAFHGKSASTVDEIMEMLENDADTNARINIHIKNSQNISPLVPAMLDILNSKKDSDQEYNTLLDFSTIVLINVLHFQDYPEKMGLLIQRFSRENESEISNYILSWNQGDIESIAFPSKTSISKSIDSKLAKIFLNFENSAKVVKKVLESLENNQLNTMLIIRSCLFYITQLYRHSLLTSELLECALEIFKKSTNWICSPESVIAVVTSVIQHPVIVNGFLPSKNNDVNFSNVLLHFINLAKDLIPDKRQLADCLSPCRDKLVKHLMRKMNKKSTLRNGGSVRILLEAFILSTDEIQLLMNKIIDTEDGKYIQENWIHIESLLLNICVEKSILLKDSIVSFISFQIVDHSETDDLRLNLLKYLERFPHYLQNTTDGEFQAILKAVIDTPHETNLLKLAQFIVSRKNSIIPLIFEQKELHNIPSILFPLLSKIKMKTLLQEEKVRKILSKQRFKIHEAVLNQEPWLVDNAAFVSSLITEFMDDESKSKLYKDFKSDWENVPQVHPAFSIVKSTVEGKTDAAQFVSDLFLILLEIIKNSPMEGYEWICQTVCETLKRSENVNFTSLLNHALWSKVVHASLKWGLRGEKNCLCSIWLMKMLRELCISTLEENGSNQITEIFELTLSHSDFINVLLDSSASQLKCETVSFILSLIKLDPKVISTSHIPIFLSSYQATLSNTDQLLLEILQLYEKNGASVWEWRPCLWGATASNFYSVRSKSVQPLWKQPRMVQVLNLLEEDIIENTIKRFPLHRSLQASDHLEIDNGEKIYDPAFVLPLIAHLLSPGADVQHRSMITSGAFAIALASLSCFSNDIRSVAYLVISRFHSHLSSDEKDQQLWQNFINVIRAGVAEIGEDHPQLPSICTIFLARSSFALSLADHPLFKPLHNFMLAKTTFSFSTVPAFLELIHSKDVKYQDHQEWILEVLRDGTRRKEDVDLLFKCFALKVLLNLYSYAYVSTTVKILILQVISSCASVRQQGLILATSYGLMPWTNHILDSAGNDEISEITSLLNKFSYYKQCSNHIKLILVSLAAKTAKSLLVSPKDMMVLLRTLNASKILNYLKKSDIEVLIDTICCMKGPDSISHARYMLDFGISHISEIDVADDIVLGLNKLIYDWFKSV